MRIGFLHSLLRKEEKLLIEEFRKRNVELLTLDVRKFSFLSSIEFIEELDAILVRTISHTSSFYAAKILESKGLLCINSSEVIKTCGDKLLTSLALKTCEIPQPLFGVSFSTEATLEVLKEMGFPVVLKPVIGSWGRLLAKVNDMEAAEALLEHKTVLGDFLHSSVFYFQKFVEKGGRDIRSFVIGDRCVAAIYRESNHWITNTARGGKAKNCPVTDDLARISVKASKAVGGGILAVDIFETQEGFFVNEVNHNIEFRNSIDVTGVNIPALIVDYIIETVKNDRKN